MDWGRRRNRPWRCSHRGNGNSAPRRRSPCRARSSHLRRHRIKRSHHNPGVRAAPVQSDIAHLPGRHNATGRAPQQLQRGRIGAADMHARRGIATVTVNLGGGGQGMAGSPLSCSAVQHRRVTQGQRGRHDPTAPTLAKHLDGRNGIRPGGGRHHKSEPQGAKTPPATER